MGRDKKVEEALNRLEQGIEKIAEVFDQYTETVRQEIAFINQRILDLESKIDSIENWASFSGETPKYFPLEPKEAPEAPPQMRPKPTPIVHEPTPSEEYTPQIREEPTPVEESYPAPVRTPPTRQPTRRTIEPASFISKENLGSGGAPSQEEFGRYRPSRGGIVEEKFVKPSVFSKELNKLQEAAATAPQTPYGPGGIAPPPSMQLRQQISAVLGKIRPEAQIRAPRPSPVQYGPPPGYQAPTQPTGVGTYGPPPPQLAYAAEPAHTPAPAPAGEVKTISVPDNWLPESSRAKYYNPKQLKKGDLKEMEKKTKDIFK
jgi:hypothetical protein